MLHSALQWLTSVTIRFTTHESLDDKGLAVVWFFLSNMGRGAGPPTPAIQPPAPIHFFPPNPRPFFSFFSGTPAQNSDFFAPPGPTHLTPAHFSSPLPPPPHMKYDNKKKYHGIVKFCKWCTRFLTLLVLKQKDSWTIGSTLLLLMLWPLIIPGSSATKVHKGTLQYRR